MKLLRRRFLKLTGVLVAGFAAGGGVDITARMIGQWLPDVSGVRCARSFRNRAGGVFNK